MTKKSRKDPLNEEQRLSLNQLHTGQVTLEFALTIFALTILTINISSAIPWYGTADIIVMGLSGLVVFIFGIVTTTTAFNLKRLGKPVAKPAIPARRWLTTVWTSAILVPILLIAFSPFKDGEVNVGSLVLLIFTVCVVLVSIVGALISLHSLWRRFNKKKRPPIRPIAYGIVGLNILLLVAFGSYTTTEIIAHNSTKITDANLELGQSEIRQAGKDGETQTKRNLLFGFPTSTTNSDAVDEIIANGSRRYQYMYCSNGSYRYYTAEQFKDESVGFTHQSPDYCAQNKQGTQTTIADVPPAEKVVQQVPVYRSPSSYTTTCNTYSYTNSITCRTY